MRRTQVRPFVTRPAAARRQPSSPDCVLGALGLAELACFRQRPRDRALRADAGHLRFHLHAAEARLGNQHAGRRDSRRAAAAHRRDRRARPFQRRGLDASSRILAVLATAPFLRHRVDVSRTTIAAAGLRMVSVDDASGKRPHGTPWFPRSSCCRSACCHSLLGLASMAYGFAPLALSALFIAASVRSSERREREAGPRSLPDVDHLPAADPGGAGPGYSGAGWWFGQSLGATCAQGLSTLRPVA